MKKRSDKKNKIIFDFRRFLTLMILMFVGIGIYIFFSVPKPVEERALRVETVESTTAQSEAEKVVEEPPVEEKSALQLEIEDRVSRAKSNVELRDGKQILYADETFGGQDQPFEGEKPVARVSIPALSFERDIFRGIGISPEGSVGEGDMERLYNATTWRYGQILGGDNYVVVSHVWSGVSAWGGDFSNDWFSPLLHSKNGGMTTKLEELKLQVGDDIFVDEAETGYRFSFKISEIVISPKESGGMSEKTKEMLSSRIDHPRITLQGCLMGEQGLVFVVGELISVEKGSEKFQLK